MADLILSVKGEYFDAIRDGAKDEEYRLANDYWFGRLHRGADPREFDRVIMLRGYPKGGGIEGITRLTRKWRGWQAKRIRHPHFGPHTVKVYAIDVSEAAHD